MSTHRACLLNASAAQASVCSIPNAVPDARAGSEQREVRHQQMRPRHVPAVNDLSRT